MKGLVLGLSIVATDAGALAGALCSLAEGLVAASSRPDWARSRDQSGVAELGRCCLGFQHRARVSTITPNDCAHLERP